MPVALRLLLISLSWILFEIGSGYVTHRMPRRLFDKDTWLYRRRRWEKGGLIYERIFKIRRWKDRLPEAGSFFKGGMSKRRLTTRSRAGLRRFIAETRRAELTHWLPILLSFTFFVWNPVNVAIWMPIFGFLANAPCIMVQRYLRPRLTALLRNRR